MTAKNSELRFRPSLFCPGKTNSIILPQPGFPGDAKPNYKSSLMIAQGELKALIMTKVRKRLQRQ